MGMSGRAKNCTFFPNVSQFPQTPIKTTKIRDEMNSLVQKPVLVSVASQQSRI